LQAHPHLSIKGFHAGLAPHSPPLGPGGLKPFKLKDTFLTTVHKTKYVQQAAN